MLVNLFRFVPALLFSFTALTMNLSISTSFALQGGQEYRNVSINTLGPVIVQEPALEITTVLPLTKSDVWVAGSYSRADALTVPLYEHFNGTKWMVIPNPDLGDGGNVQGLSAQSAHDIWAVGTYRTNPNNPVDLPLIEHWNGSHWSMVNQSYSGTFATGGLTAVVALAANNVWMAGTQRSNLNSTATQTFIEHWNGSQIQMIASPNPIHTTSNSLKAITAGSANDIWSVGISDTGNTLTEHWDGSQWTVVASPDITFNQGIPNFNLLKSTSSASKNDVWAVGLFNATAASFKGALAEHWNGTQWSISSLQDLPGGSQELSAVVSLAVNDSWALGTSTINNRALPLLSHWNGTGWKNVNLPTSLTSLQHLQRFASSTTSLVSMGKSIDGTLQLILLQSVA